MPMNVTNEVEVLLGTGTGTCSTAVRSTAVRSYSRVLGRSTRIDNYAASPYLGHRINYGIN